ncbi:hypothetical protein BUE80_DR002829 [Diplocarpon rosae]|nr:hypothetical protein BUE80_DR002829 [Diplocarpon rosae]
MRFSHTLIFAAWASLARAQNPFTFTELNSVTAGQSFTITWAPSTGSTDTVTLLLRQGDEKDLGTVETIAANIQNTGSYVWTPSTSLVNGGDYAFEIVDNGNTDIVNYSNQFNIISTNTVSAVRPSSTPASSVFTSVSTSTPAPLSSTSKPATNTGISTETESASRTSTTSTKSGNATGSVTASPTALSGSGSLKVGVGMLAMVGAMMALL